MKNNENHQVIKAGFGYTIGNYLIKGLSFLTIPLFTRMLSTSDYGIYNAFAAYSNLLYVFMGFAIHTSYRNAKLKYEGAEKYNDYVSTTLLFQFSSLILWLIIGSIFGKYLGNLLGLNKEMVLLLIVYSFSLAVITAFNTNSSIDYKVSTP